MPVRSVALRQAPSAAVVPGSYALTPLSAADRHCGPGISLRSFKFPFDRARPDADIGEMSAVSSHENPAKFVAMRANPPRNDMRCQKERDVVPLDRFRSPGHHDRPCSSSSVSR